MLRKFAFDACSVIELTVVVPLQQNETAIFLDKIVAIFAKKVALGLFFTSPTKKRDDPT